MNQTTNLGLNLPEYTDTVDIEQLNANFTLIDEKLPAPSTAIPLVAGPAKAGTSTAYSRGDHVHPREVVWVNRNASARTLYLCFAANQTVGYKDADSGIVYFLTTASSERYTETGDSGTRTGYVSTATLVGGGKRITCYTDSVSNINRWTFSDIIAYQPSITTTGILKGGGSGSIGEAEAGVDYMAPVVVTTEDNGKFLRVVDGSWTAVAVDSASGVSF